MDIELEQTKCAECNAPLPIKNLSEIELQELECKYCGATYIIRNGMIRQSSKRRQEGFYVNPDEAKAIQRLKKAEKLEAGGSMFKFITIGVVVFVLFITAFAALPFLTQTSPSSTSTTLSNVQKDQSQCMIYGSINCGIVAQSSPIYCNKGDTLTVSNGTQVACIATGTCYVYQHAAMYCAPKSSFNITTTIAHTWTTSPTSTNSTLYSEGTFGPDTLVGGDTLNMSWTITCAISPPIVFPWSIPHG